MRILYECPTMARAGTWFRCFYLARALAERSHDVTLVKIATDRRLIPRTFLEDGVRVVETPRGWGSRWSHSNTRLVSDLVWRGAHAIRESFDVVHTFSHHVNAMLPGFAAKLTHRETLLVADWDDLWTDGGLRGDAPTHGAIARADFWFDAWCERNLKRGADLVTVVSHDLLTRAISHGVSPERVVWVPNGAPTGAIFPGDRLAARHELGLPPDRPIGVFVGYGQYDVDMVLDALVDLRRAGTTFFVVFTGPHADLTSAGAARRGVQDDVRAAGLVPFETMVRYLQAADVGLMPYADTPLNRARWPIKLGDYLAAGLPVATCAVGEMGRVVPEWGVGIASAPEPHAFATAIRTIIGQPDADAASDTARRAALRIAWPAVVLDLESAYREEHQRLRSS